MRFSMRRDAHHFFPLTQLEKLVGMVCTNFLIEYNLISCLCSHDILSHDWLSTEGFIDETIQANQIMGDLCDSNDIYYHPMDITQPWSQRQSGKPVT